MATDAAGALAELVRALVRPIISLYLVGVCGFLWVKGQPIPAELLALTSSLVSYWFAARFADKQAEKNGAPKG